MTAMSWTTPDEIKAQVQRLWDQGRLLAASITGDPLFPLQLRLRRPGARDLSDRFDAVRAWIKRLDEDARPNRGFGYEIDWGEVNHRQLGRNRVPVGLVMPARSDALRLIGKVEAAERFEELVRATCDVFPALRQWVARKPLTMLDHASDWDRILDVLAWFHSHPRSGLYLRQVDVAGVDTKFIEARKGLLAELLDLVLPQDAVDPDAVGLKGFEARYGLVTKPRLIRFRILDGRHAISGLADLTVPIAQFASLALDVRLVFVTENEVNGLAFPPIQDSIVVFGLGYALELLASVGWLVNREMHYWGDIDTHGFAMLDGLRSNLPHVRSLLMDRETLMAHQSLWSVEDVPHVGHLPRLVPSEQALYGDLRLDRLGRRVRLEQERVSFGALERALDKICRS
jgi:hypothetical protein